MGDRNNPMKFGPEWLRNLSRERSVGSSGSNNQNSSATSTNTNNAGSGGAPGLTSNHGSAGGSSSNATANAVPKVQLAKLRYGREEMLALYDRSSQAPPELKFIDILYHPRGKPPVALNNTLEDEMGESVRAGPPIGNVSQVDRFGLGRVGRGSSVSDGRGRPRMPFVRQTSAGRGSWHIGSTRTPYSGGADDDTSASLRSWNNSNGSNTAVRNSGDLAEWTQNKMFRNKRPGSSTNWRQPTREDEWRTPDGSRSRSSQQEKWERDWGDRPNQEKSQSWNNNRRTWVGGDSQNDDNLPEWAMDNAEACAGTFDSSGAFHGYSNDDSNLPKTQESAYSLTRSHTQGIFVRSKTAEEGSDEWWASEKAKKLSPKRFDASDIKFKKPSVTDVNIATSLNTKGTASAEENLQNNVQMSDLPTVTSESSESNSASTDDSSHKKNVRFTESNTFDALMRSDINIEEANDERGNFQSVMITPNNSLRQKHQNIVTTPANVSNRQNQNILKQDILQIFQNNQCVERDPPKQHQTPEDKIVEDIVDMTLEDKEIISNLSKPSDNPLGTPSTSIMSSGLSNVPNTMSQLSNPMMQLRISSPVLPNQGLNLNMKPGGMQPGGIQSSAMQGSGMQPSAMQGAGITTPGMQSAGLSSAVGMTNSALNAAMRLPIGNTNNTLSQTMGIPLPAVPQQVLPNQGIPNPAMGATGLQNTGAGTISSFQSQQGKANVFPMHALQHSGSDAAFGSSIYASILPHSPTSTANAQSLTEQWYYEDPTKQIQGPFTSKEMYNWYRAGFFSPNLMVRRACDSTMRPLGSYGPVVPFAQMDMMYPLSNSFEPRSQPSRDTMLNSQQGLGLDVMNMNLSESNSMQFSTVGMMGNPPFAQQQMDSLWSQPDLLWMQQAMGSQRAESRVNNMPMFFWDQQPSAFTSNALLPEEIAKEMKTEDQILAQLRASQNINTSQNLHFLNEAQASNVGPSVKPEDTFTSTSNTTPNLKELHKLIQEDTLKEAPSASEVNQALLNTQIKDKITLDDQVSLQDFNNFKSNRQTVSKPALDARTSTKAEVEKSVKSKENTNTKNKTKKLKEDKKEETVEIKSKDEEIIKTERKVEEIKKKDDKLNKKDVEKEKKEWIKEGFTVVKADKNTTKENKKKVEELIKAEEAERKRLSQKEEEKLAAEEEKKRKQAETAKKQQDLQQQQQRQAAESASKKAPWSAVATQAMQAPSKDGLTLAEIQRLEREKKLEQMKEQQQMMQLIAQQQAAALAREQEISLGWAKKKGNTAPASGQSLAEIQAETRKQAAVAAAAAAATSAAQTMEEAQPPPPAAQAPWANTQNGGGFWDTLPNQPVKSPVSPKAVDPNKNKKKVSVNTSAKKDSSPAAEFEMWCNTVLTSWNSKIDVPTFVSFLKDIESPYEVKDYVKCYLGESKDTSDFSRQFLERRSKLLRVGMVTPSDDLCSPAMAVNPRTISGSDYQEVKGKGKKTKKNKMLKVDARILGFSVTAAEDRINVGDIDTV